MYRDSYEVTGHFAPLFRFDINLQSENYQECLPSTQNAVFIVMCRELYIFLLIFRFVFTEKLFYGCFLIINK